MKSNTKRRPPGPSGRDLGLSAPGAGKGDSPRNLSAKFRENFDEINFRSPGYGDLFFKRHGSKLIKTYK